MRTATRVCLAGSLVVFAACSSSQNGSGDDGYYGTGATAASSNGASSNGASSNGASSNGASANGATGTGANGATGTSGTGSTACLVGNPCSTPGSYCVNGNTTCTCVNDAWGLCTDSSNGTGGTTSTACGDGNSCSTPGSTCSTGVYSCTCSDSLLWQSCTTLATGGTTSTGGRPPTSSGGVGNGANSGGSSSGTGASTGTGATSGTGGGCASASGSSKPIPPVLFFAIDSTSSMNDVPASGSTNGQSKWAALRSVWPQVISGLPSSWAAGLMLWSCPNCPNARYQPSTLVPIGPLDSTQVGSLSNLPNSPPGGYTPTECAYNYALQQVVNWVAPPAYAQSPRYIVLLTDGVPTVTNDCQTLGAVTAQPHAINQAQYDGLIATVSTGTLSTGVQTFVAGVPGSDEPQGAPYDPMYELSLLAAAGQTALAGCTPAPGTVNNNVGNYGTVSPRGTYCHYDLTAAADFASALRDALSSIAQQLISCEYPVPTPPPGYIMLSTTQVDVTYTSSSGQTALSYATADDCSQGGDWFYANYDAGGVPTRIDLCPDMCVTAQSDLNASIEIQFTCLGEP